MINKVSLQAENKLLNKQQKNKSFKGPGTALLTGLGGLNDSPALGACAVDLCSMVIPRTAIEYKNRGTQAGIESAIREGSSCLLHACVGLIGFAAASLLSKGFNQQHGIKAQNIFASGDTVKNMSEIWKQTDGDGSVEQFFKGFVGNLQGLSGKHWKNVSEIGSSPIVENLVKMANKTSEMATKSGAEKKALSKEIKNLKEVVVSQLTKDTGAQMSYKLKGIKDASGNVVAKEISASAAELVDSAVSLSNSFKTKTKEKLPDFVQGLMKNKSAATILGLGVCAALCLSFQPINTWLTKKRTGQDGFVGVEDKQADNSKGFKAAKTALGVGFPIFAMTTIGKPANLLSNIQFMSKIPTINQFKFLYGLTIGSRFLSARDKNELRESTIKDTLGFTNWLILGGMVSKLTARALGGKALINNPVKTEGKKGLKYAFDWISKASVKSFDEVLMPKAKEVVKDGKVLPLAQMYKKASPTVKKQVKQIATSQIAGYLYSGLVLGIGIAKLNIFITKKMQEKKKMKEALASETTSQVQSQAQNKVNNAQNTQVVASAQPTQSVQTTQTAKSTNLLEQFLK